MRLILKKGLSLFMAAILAAAFICPASIAEEAAPIVTESVTSQQNLLISENTDPAEPAEPVVFEESLPEIVPFEAANADDAQIIDPAPQEGDAIPAENESENNADEEKTPASAGFELAQSALSLAIGDAYDLRALIRGSEGAIYTYASSDPDAVSVNAAGVIIAKTAGDVVITIADANDPAQSHTISISVSQAEESVSIAITPATLGARMQGTIAIEHTSGVRGLYDLEYDASAIDVRKLDEDTYICTAKAVDSPRTITVRAVSASGNVLGSAEVCIAPAPKMGEICFESAQVDLALGDTETRLAAKCASGAICEFTYESSDPDLVSIDPVSGKISAKAITPAGTFVTITAFDKNNPAVRADCAVRVCAAPETIAFTVESLRMATGEQVNLYDYLRAQPEGAAIGRNCGFAADGDCVSIDARGVLTAVSSGSAVITAACGSATCTLLVRVLRSGAATISPASIRMGGGATASFTISWPQDCGSLYRIECDTKLIDILSITEGESSDTVSIAAHSVDTEIDARICIIDANGAEIGALPVTILPAPLAGEVYFAPEDQSIEISIGETGRYARAKYAVGTLCDFIYESSDPKLVQVDRESGLLTPVALTENGVCAVITATAKNNPDAQATCRVIVTNAPERVYFAQDSVQIGVGETYDLRDAGLTLEPESAETVFSYASSREDIAQVSDNGIVTGVAQGTATITATARNGKSASIAITVAAKSGSLTFEKGTFSIGAGMRGALKVVHSSGYGGSYRVKSSRAALQILSVNRTASGTDTIIISARDVVTATEAQVILYGAEGNTIASCTVTILPAPATIRFDSDQISMRIGAQTQLLVINPHENTMCDFSYSSADPSIARVSRDGTVTAVRAGTTIITVRASGSGAMAKCTVTVLPMPDQIIGAKNEICLGTRQQVAFTTVPAAADCEYTYSIANTSIVTVDASGMIAGLACGTTQITVKTPTGVTATFDITVVPYNTQHETISTAHRGASGYRTENTLDAFQYANELGADEIELDVYRTADGVLIVHHDDQIKYGSKYYHPSALTYAQVLSAKSYVCTLDQALAYIATTNMTVLIEFKMNSIESDVINCVERNNVQAKAGYIAFDNTCLNEVNRLRANQKTGFLIDDQSLLNAVIANPENYPYSMVSVRYYYLTETNVRDLHLRGYKVVAWTVDDATEIARLKRIGVDSITTNYPDRV